VELCGISTQLVNLPEIEFWHSWFDTQPGCSRNLPTRDVSIALNLSNKQAIDFPKRFLMIIILNG